MKAASHLWNLTFDIYNMKEVDKAGGPEEIAESRKISPVCPAKDLRVLSHLRKRLISYDTVGFLFGLVVVPCFVLIKITSWLK